MNVRRNQEAIQTKNARLDSTHTVDAFTNTSHVLSDLSKHRAADAKSFTSRIDLRPRDHPDMHPLLAVNQTSPARPRYGRPASSQRTSKQRQEKETETGQNDMHTRPPTSILAPLHVMPVIQAAR